MLEKPVITECPRDGMQGIKTYIPVKTKADYINSLLKSGFDIIDFGSFVSPGSIPQLKDTHEVLELLDLSDTFTRLMVLVANIKGAERAAGFEKISFMSFPFSVSPAFLKLNINSDFKQALLTINKILELCLKNHKKLKVYIAMAFGNPYYDECNFDIVSGWVEIFRNMGIDFITLSDVTGISKKENIAEAYSRLINEYPEIEFGFHLHTKPGEWYERIEAAYNNGCRSFDAVINGMGGCPMTNYELVGNLSTENLLDYFEGKKVSINIDKSAFNNALSLNKKIFDKF
jgi:hydroxymethylglutaryl-CoA lyase